MADNRLDIIIFGGTGVTGQFVIEHLIKSIDQENGDITFGIAGRNEVKLKQSLTHVLDITNKQIDVPIIIADVNDEESILKMCKRGKIIINCVGPYSLWGEVVVKNCILSGTHHVDLSGEPYYLEGTQLKYNERAIEAGVLIVAPCGFDSIPSELGIDQLRKHVRASGGELASVDYYMNSKYGPDGYVLNHGTWDSAVGFFGDLSKVKPIREQLFRPNGFFSKNGKELPRYRHENVQKYLPHTPPEIGKLVVPFWDTDKFVNRRTQFQNYVERDERPIQLAAYMVVGSWIKAIGIGLAGALFVLLASFSYGRKWLHEKPHWFTFGNVSKNGPTRAQVKGSSFEMTMIGKGWHEKLASAIDEPSNAPERLIIGRWRAPEAAYDATSIFFVQSAITIIKERGRIGYAGGVLTPGLVFRDTTLVERLKRHSIYFDIE